MTPPSRARKPGIHASGARGGFRPAGAAGRTAASGRTPRTAHRRRHRRDGRPPPAGTRVTCSPGSVPGRGIPLSVSTDFVGTEPGTLVRPAWQLAPRRAAGSHQPSRPSRSRCHRGPSARGRMNFDTRGRATSTCGAAGPCPRMGPAASAASSCRRGVPARADTSTVAGSVGSPCGDAGRSPFRPPPHVRGHERFGPRPAFRGLPHHRGHPGTADRRGSCR